MRKALSWLMLWLIALSSAFTISWAFAWEVQVQEVQVQEVQVQDNWLFDKVKNSIIPKTEAYTFSMTWGLVVEQADVDTVGEQAWVWAMSYLQILKFLWIGILITVTGLIVNKVFGLVKFG